MKTQQLKELAQRATPWPWKWFTSNSHNRLSSVPSGKDGDVISAFKAVDGVACVSVSRADMAFIEAAHPGAVITLIERLEAAERANAAQDDHINQQQTRVEWLEAANSGLGKALCAAERERDELKRNQELNLKIKQAMHERFTRAEAELARRDAAAVIGWTDAQELRDVEKNGCGYLFKANPISPNADPRRVIKLYTAARPAVLPPGWKLVPIEPTEDMVISGFESEPDEHFSEPRVWDAFEAMSGCEQAAHKARLCYAAMLAAAPAPGEKP
ncbi:ead/Ea22-like family protein [Pantoea agglomerans]|uniref:Uncharacterized protein n=1 Tax=Enterobacter agglomerans TaxID=549 RepID=A0ACC5RGY7_ENTAG|nr:ead/Ea22-like family protein [Pantoea agglomerans]MBK4723942.1 hypothetical protein [Pantoea agglomerans]